MAPQIPPQLADRHARHLRRPATDTTPEFDLAYARGGPRGSTPVVVIPGGPGLGSLLPYLGFRRRAAQGGLDVIMVEHRGIGFSRTDLGGRDLPSSAMNIIEVIDDIAAVLDREGIARAHIVGASYGTYLASAFGARHPDRVAGMLLDSALQSAESLNLERHTVRELFWHADTAAAEATHALIDAGVDSRILLDVARAAYELGGDELLVPVLRQRANHAHTAAWSALQLYATRDRSIARFPGIYEFDLSGVIGFRELGYGGHPDGLPLDPALTYSEIADLFPAFAGEPFDLAEETPKFPWPLVLLVGTRDLRTPPPIAREVAATAQDAVLVHIENGHSALESHPLVLLNTIRALVRGREHSLPAASAALDRLPRRGLAARIPELLGAATLIESTVRP
ncbi:alpha/beta fold hydrolase [Pseudoclavibacter sp. Z016]|uniref:alpha/beta fold hydrolase n=1 Tax=Pseudoclavibacter sp. Z016 TaxID=2080581 RepID=UPI002157B9A2|nr:alpha/beta hydrolase [Pseudoclavibacter sp. Z016]